MVGGKGKIHRADIPEPSGFAYRGKENAYEEGQTSHTGTNSVKRGISATHNAEENDRRKRRQWLAETKHEREYVKIGPPPKAVGEKERGIRPTAEHWAN